MKTETMASPSCNCGHLSCVCEIKKAHAESCKYRRAATCSVPIACEPHGRDTCPVCDPCTCGRAPTAKQIHRWMVERRRVKLRGGRVGRIVRIDTELPSGKTTVRVWFNRGNVRGVAVGEIEGIA